MKTHQMTPEQVVRLMCALEPAVECSNSSLRPTTTHKAKDRRLAQRMAAQQRPFANKVSKGTRLDLCSGGGFLPNRFNDSGRAKMSKEGIELPKLYVKGAV